MNTQTKFIREYHRNTRLKKVAVHVVQIAIVVFLAFVCALFFFRQVVVSDASMEPSVSMGSKVLINAAAYTISSLERGDIIVFSTDDDGEVLQIKRVVGLPGESVQIKDGQIYINGELLQEDQEYDLINNPGIAETPVSLDKGEYFVLGDNRNNSIDSRHIEVGVVSLSQIKGKLWLRYSPSDEFGLVQ